VRGHRLLCVSLFQHCNGIYISAVAHGCVPMPILQWHLHICSGSHVCLPVLPLLPTSTAFLSTSTVFVVYQYCLCCLPVLPCCLPILALLSTSTAFLSATGPRYAALLHGNSQPPQNPLHPHSTACFTMRITVNRHLLGHKQDRLLDSAYIMSASAWLCLSS